MKRWKLPLGSWEQERAGGQALLIVVIRKTDDGWRRVEERKGFISRSSPLLYKNPDPYLLLKGVIWGSGFPYCGYLEPEDFFGTDYADCTDWLRVFGGMGIEKKLSGGRGQGAVVRGQFSLVFRCFLSS